MVAIEPKDPATKEKLDELMKPKAEGDITYLRIVDGLFFKHTITKDGKHTAEVLNKL